MNISEKALLHNTPYSLFLNSIDTALQSVKAPPKEIYAQAKYVDLPTFPAPVELLEVEAHFPGAICLITFCQSEVDHGLYSCDVELQREGEESLYLSDFLADQDDPRQKFLRFTEDELNLEAGVARMVEVLVALLNEELLPVLKGDAWVTAPFDWGDYK